MKRRLRYLDAARGLAIFTVVYSHICLFCLPEYNSSVVIDFLRSYFLNAFFFISGYVAYKSSDSIKGELPCLLIKKIQQLLIPTILVASIYALSHHIGLTKFFTDEAKIGYWFTIVLFEMYVIYLIVIGVSSVINYRNAQTVLLTILAAIFYVIHKTFILDSPLQYTLCIGSLTYYIPFFCFGILCKRHNPLVINILQIGGVFPLQLFSRLSSLDIFFQFLCLFPICQ